MSKNKNDHGRSGGKDHDDHGHGHKDLGKLLVGTSGDDTLTGSSRNDLIIGRKGDDWITGGAGNDILIGDGGWGGKGWHWIWGHWGKPRGSDDDYLDGGAGSDRILAGKGDDVANYTLSENNRKAHDVYDGGKGFDTLQLTLTYAELQLSSVQQDIAAFEAFLDKRADARGDNGKTFEFKSFNLDVRNFEALEIVLLNTPPVAVGDAYAVNEDQVLFIAGPGVLANDTDVDGDALSAMLVAGPAHGTLALNADGSFVYTPGANYHGGDSFTYRVNDGDLDSNVATVAIAVASVNDDPVADDEAYSIHAGQTLFVPAGEGLLVGDTDPEGDSLSLYDLDVTGLQGQLGLIQLDGSFMFTPTAGFVGQTSFQYVVTDGLGGTDTATVFIDVTNESPVADDEAYSIHAGQTLIVPAGEGMLVGDTDPEGDPLSLWNVDVTGLQGQLGLIQIDGSFMFTPAAGFVGQTSFTYVVADAFGATDTATVYIDVTNESPVADDDAYTVLAGQMLFVAAGEGLLAGDTDPEGDPLSLYDLDVTGLQGQLGLIQLDGSFMFTPAAGFVGQTSFTYVVTDAFGATDTATVTIDVVNAAPVAAADEATTDEDTPVVIDVLANDTDANGDALTASVLEGPLHGDLVPNADGTFTYSPDAEFSGTDSFTYVVNDGRVDSAVATVALTVNPVNDEPEGEDIVIGGEPGAIRVAVIGGAASTYTAVAAQIADTLEFDFDVAAIAATAFASETGWSGLLAGYDVIVLGGSGAGNDYGDTGLFAALGDFVADGGGVVTTGWFQQVMAGTSGQTLADADAITPLSGSATAWAATGSTITISDSAHPIAGGLTSYTTQALFHELGTAIDPTATVLATGIATSTGAPLAAIAYDDEAGGRTAYLGSLHFALENPYFSSFLRTGAADELLERAVAWAAGEPESGAAADQNEPFVISASLLLAGATDAEGDPIFISAVSPFSTLGAEVFIDEDGNIVYDPTEGLKYLDEGEVVTDTFTYTLSNSDGSFSLFAFSMSSVASDGSTGTVTLTVEGVNDAPDAVNDVRVTNEDSEITGNVLANDIDPEGHALTVTTTGTFITTRGAEVTLNANGSYSYDPTVSAQLQALAHGTSVVDSFGYTISDGKLTDTAYVNVTVAGLNEPGSGGGVPSKILSQTSGDLDYYVRFEIDGAPGQWLELSGFSLGAEVPVLLGGGGGGVGKVKMDEVHLTLGSSAAVVGLTKAIAAGQVVDVEVEAYRQNTKDGKALLVDEYRFDTAFLSGLTTAGSPNATAEEVSFNFTKITHTHQAQSGTGGIGDKATVSYNVQTNDTDLGNSGATGDAITKLPTADLPVDVPLTYYMTYQGAPGWLELDGFSVGLENSTSIGSESGGAGAGKVKMGDVSLGLGSSKQIVELMAKMTRGEHLDFLEVEAYRQNTKDGKPVLVDEYYFDTVFLTDLDTSGSANVLGIDAGKFAHGHVQASSTGGAGSSSVQGWDFIQNVAWNNGAPDADAGSKLPALSQTSGDLDYYVRFEIDGAPGQWLELSGFSLGAEVPVLLGGGGGGVGKVKMDEVHLTLGSSAAVVGLTKAIAAGQVVDVEVEAYRQNTKDGKALLVDEYRFDTAFLSGLTTAGSPNATAEEVSFNFTKITHTHQAQSGTGGIGDKATVSYNVQTNDTDLGNSGATGDAITKLPTADLPVDVPLTYYMTYQGAPGWLELDGFSVGLENSTSIGSESGGAGAGKVKMGDVSLGLGSSKQIVELMAKMTRGEHLDFLEVEAYRQNTKDGKPVLVDEYYFDTVFLTDLDTSGSANVLGIDAGKFAHGHVQASSTGGAGSSSVQGWDFIQNVAWNNGAPDADAGSKLPALSQTSGDLDYYVRFEIDGAPGQWLELSGFSLGAEVPVLLGGGGGGVGKVKMDEVHLTLGSSAAVVGLTKAIAAGQVVDVEVEAYRQNTKDGKALLVDEYRFDTAFLSGLTTAGSPNATAEEVSFNFTKITHTHQAQSGTGGIGDKATVSYNVQTNDTDLGNSGATGDAITKLPTADLPVDVPLTYYMTYQGAPGWLELDGFSVGLENSTSIGSESGGAGAGKVKMGDVSLGLGSSKQIVELMAKMTRGEHLDFLEVEAYRQNTKDGKPVLVDEYYFDTVFLTDLDTSGSANVLGIDAGKFAHGHVQASSTGGAGSSSVQGWDFIQNVAWNNGAPDSDLF